MVGMMNLPLHPELFQAVIGSYENGNIHCMVEKENSDQ